MAVFKAKVCEVCKTHPEVFLSLCKGCGQAFSRSVPGLGVMAALRWAAKRARRFEHARCRRVHGRRV